MGGSRNSVGGYIPRERGSAGLEALVTKEDWISKRPGRAWMKVLMRLKTSLVSVFRWRPFHQPSTTPLLSPRVVRSLPSLGIVDSAWMSNLKPIASAHPMSRCPCAVCHPGMSLHALQNFPMMMPMPMPELASEKAWGSEKDDGGYIGRDTSPAWRSSDHQRRSSAMPLMGR